jgi:glycosyltransferase involved in cell wall biosynthesis
MNQRKLSIVIPVFNEEESLPHLYERIMENVKDLSDLIDSHELIFVDDGSKDGSLKLIRALAEKDPNVHAVVLRRNFGKAAALSAGFDKADGDIIITMDADLQDDPCELRAFIEKLDEGYDLVSGWKYNRLDPLEKRLPSKLFNRVTRKMSGVKLHDFNCGFKAYRRDVVKTIDVYGEYHRYIPVLAHREGFRIAEIKVHHNKREFGKSKYGFERYLRGFFDSMSSSFLLLFFERPMYFFGRRALEWSGIGFAAVVAQILLWIFNVQWGATVLLIGALAFAMSFLSLCMGFLGNMITDAEYRNGSIKDHIHESF